MGVADGDNMSVSENERSEALRKGRAMNWQTDDGSTALHLAARNGHTKCVEILLRYGANVAVTDGEGRKPLEALLASGKDLRSLRSSTSALSLHISSDSLMPESTDGALAGEDSEVDNAFPDDVSQWTEKEVGRWLHENGIGQYEYAFKENNVNGKVLLKLNQKMLKSDLGVRSFGHRALILNLQSQTDLRLSGSPTHRSSFSDMSTILSDISSPFLRSHTSVGNVSSTPLDMLPEAPTVRPRPGSRSDFTEPPQKERIPTRLPRTKGKRVEDGYMLLEEEWNCLFEPQLNTQDVDLPDFFTRLKMYENSKKAKAASRRDKIKDLSLWVTKVFEEYIVCGSDPPMPRCIQNATPDVSNVSKMLQQRILDAFESTYGSAMTAAFNRWTGAIYTPKEDDGEGGGDGDENHDGDSADEDLVRECLVDKFHMLQDSRFCLDKGIPNQIFEEPREAKVITPNLRKNLEKALSAQTRRQEKVYRVLLDHVVTLFIYESAALTPGEWAVQWREVSWRLTHLMNSEVPARDIYEMKVKSAGEKRSTARRSLMELKSRERDKMTRLKSHQHLVHCMNYDPFPEENESAEDMFAVKDTKAKKSEIKAATRHFLEISDDVATVTKYLQWIHHQAKAGDWVALAATNSPPGRYHAEIIQLLKDDSADLKNAIAACIRTCRSDRSTVEAACIGAIAELAGIPEISQQLFDLDSANDFTSSGLTDNLRLRNYASCHPYLMLCKGYAETITDPTVITGILQWCTVIIRHRPEGYRSDFNPLLEDVVSVLTALTLNSHCRKPLLRNQAFIDACTALIALRGDHPTLIVDLTAMLDPLFLQNDGDFVATQLFPVIPNAKDDKVVLVQARASATFLRWKAAFFTADPAHMTTVVTEVCDLAKTCKDYGWAAVPHILRDLNSADPETVEPILGELVKRMTGDSWAKQIYTAITPDVSTDKTGVGVLSALEALVALIETMSDREEVGAILLSTLETSQERLIELSLLDVKLFPEPLMRTPKKDRRCYLALTALLGLLGLQKSETIPKALNNGLWNVLEQHLLSVASTQQLKIATDITLICCDVASEKMLEFGVCKLLAESLCLHSSTDFSDSLETLLFTIVKFSGREWACFDDFETMTALLDVASYIDFSFDLDAALNDPQLCTKSQMSFAACSALRAVGHVMRSSAKCFEFFRGSLLERFSDTIQATVYNCCLENNVATPEEEFDGADEAAVSEPPRTSSYSLNLPQAISILDFFSGCLTNSFYAGELERFLKWPAHECYGVQQFDPSTDLPSVIRMWTERTPLKHKFHLLVKEARLGAVLAHHITQADFTVPVGHLFDELKHCVRDGRQWKLASECLRTLLVAQEFEEELSAITAAAKAEKAKIDQTATSEQREIEIQASSDMETVKEECNAKEMDIDEGVSQSHGNPDILAKAERDKAELSKEKRARMQAIQRREQEGKLSIRARAEREKAAVEEDLENKQHNARVVSNYLVQATGPEEYDHLKFLLFVVTSPKVPDLHKNFALQIITNLASKPRESPLTPPVRSSVSFLAAMDSVAELTRADPEKVPLVFQDKCQDLVKKVKLLETRKSLEAPQAPHHHGHSPKPPRSDSTRSMGGVVTEIDEELRPAMDVDDDVPVEPPRCAKYATAVTRGSMAVDPVLDQKRFDVYLCHSWGLDKAGGDNHVRVRELARQLREMDETLRIWLDEEQLDGESVRWSTVSNGMAASILKVVVVTDQMVAKAMLDAYDNTCAYELRTLYKENDATSVIPVYAEEDVVVSGLAEQVIGQSVGVAMTSRPEGPNSISHDQVRRLYTVIKNTLQSKP